MKTTLKIIFLFAFCLVAIVGGFVGFLAVSEYKPEPCLSVQLRDQQNLLLPANEDFTITSFNIGYSALDLNTDFFMDGGTMSRGISLERVQANLAKITGFLQEVNSDVYLIQEVDKESTRSYKVDQDKAISQALVGYDSSFGINYKVAWVPVPLFKPMGKVFSGILTLSRFKTVEATRFTLPGHYSWPTRLAQLDRCLLETRIGVSDGSELVVGHIHLSAFDQGGVIRNQQLGFLEQYAREEYEKGNYVIIGGDWNHLLSKNPQERRARSSANWPFWLQILPRDFLPEFKWAFDEAIPSNRTMDAPYDPHSSFVATIDGFLVSPNLDILTVFNHDLGFEFSDHNPVTVQLRLQQSSIDAEEEETIIEGSGD